MNEPTTGERRLWKEGASRGAQNRENAEEKAARGGGARGGAPWKPGLCKGNHLVAAEAQARPGCLEKLLSSLTPFMKQEENISSV